jgi:hypothetical protein
LQVQPGTLRGLDVTIQVLLVAEIVWKLVSQIIDVETAFLHGDLEKESYMDCPDGLDQEVLECLLLLKMIYGLVQAARAFYKKYVALLKLCGFTKSPVDPCIMVRRDKLGTVYMALHMLTTAMGLDIRTLKKTQSSRSVAISTSRLKLSY